MPEFLSELERRGWRFTRDGSTATAYLPYDDPDDPGSGWEIYVLHTAGHGSRFTLDPLGSGLTERSLSDAERLRTGLAEAVRLLSGWRGELPGEGPASGNRSAEKED